MVVRRGIQEEGFKEITVKSKASIFLFLLHMWPTLTCTTAIYIYIYRFLSNFLVYSNGYNVTIQLYSILIKIAVFCAENYHNFIFNVFFCL